MIQSKINIINDYFRQNGLSAAVVGMSGGVDSALVAALFGHAMQEHGSPLRRVVGVVAPIRTSGATTQDEAEERGVRCCKAAGIESWVIPLTEVQLGYERAMAGSPSQATGNRLTWANGQILSIARTPLFYGVAAHLQAEGYPSVVVGTTNRSEGSYIGFYGKASDGAVDLQAISDLWKSQVWHWACALNVPPDVIDATPRGDVWDGRADEEMIGAPYDFLERYLEAKVRSEALTLSAQERVWAGNIEALHQTNAHKYRVGSPAVHLDVCPRYVPGGWSAHNTLSWSAS